MKTKTMLCVILLAFTVLFLGSSHADAATPEDRNQLETVSQLIKKLANEKDWRGVVQISTNAIDKFPNVPDLFFYRAEALKELKQFEAALTDYDKVRRALPGDAWPYLGTAEVYFQQNKFEQAEESAAAGLKIDPSFGVLLHLSAILNLQLGQKDLASQRYGELQRVDPKLAEKVSGGLRDMGLGTSASSAGLRTKSTYSEELEKALEELRSGNVEAGRQRLLSLYKVDRQLLFRAGGVGLDSDIVSALYVAEVLQLNLINATLLYGDFDRYSRADDFAYSMYQYQLKTRGPSDSLTIRSLAAAAMAHASFGRLSLALTRLSQGVALSDANMTASDAALIQLMFSEIYSAMGRRRDAQFSADKALKLLNSGVAQSEDLTLLALVFQQNSLVSMSDAKGAEKFSAEITAKLQRLNRTNTFFAAEQAVTRGQILVALGKIDDAIEWRGKAIAWQQSIPNLQQRPQARFFARVFQRMSWLTQSFGGQEFAARIQETAVKVLNQNLGSYSPVTTVAEVDLVSVLIRAGRLTDALALSRSVVPKLEALRSNMELSDEDRMATFSQVAHAYRDAAYLELASDQSLSFRASELSKARSLLESNMVRRAVTSNILDAADKNKIESFGATILSLDQQIASARLIGESTATAELKRQQVTTEKRALQKSFATKYPKYAQLTEVHIARPVDVVAELQPGETFVSYLVTADNLLIYVVKQSGLRAVRVPIRASEVKTLVASARAYFTRQPESGDSQLIKAKQAVDQLSKLMLEPVGGEIAAAKALVISPDESLAMLPFDALNFEGKPLVVTKDVTMIQSGSLFVLARQELKLERHYDLQLLAIGGPQYEVDPNAVPALVAASSVATTSPQAEPVATPVKPDTNQNGRPQATVVATPAGAPKESTGLFGMIGNAFKSAFESLKSFFANLKVEPREIDVASFMRGNSGDGKAVARAFAELKNRWPNLPGAQQEVAEVAALFQDKDRTVIKGQDASEMQLQQLNASGQLAKYRYMLFSTHGYLSMFEPALSSVVLSQTNTTDDADGYVTASEWAGYRLNSELIVLSACDTAVGDVVQGEGVTGLPYAMSVAGNRRSILSLWPVADDGTKEFMVSMFRRIHAGKPIRAALSETKREFATHKTFSSPIYWAPFVLYGG